MAILSFVWKMQRMQHVQRCALSSKFGIGIVLAVLLAGSAKAENAPANTLYDLRRAFQACIATLPMSGGSELTIVFALKRDGSLLGKPKITHARLIGDKDTQMRFAAAAVAALAQCLPVNITRELGSAIAGRVFSIRIMSRARTIET